MIVFLSGPISYNPSRARRQFKRFERRFKRMDMVVLNPTVLPDGMEYEQYMAICKEMIDQADGVIMIPGWEKSPGAIRERQYALASGKPLFEVGL